MSNSSLQIRLRPSSKRGNADHGWLKTFHTFSFANYFDPNMDSFGSLRVINEDRVSTHSGFPTHPHSRFEIWSYILSGSLGHKDSMGNVESITRGDVQLTYAGSGIRHSEYNDNEKDECHFLQIWAVPPEGKQAGTPRYYTRRYGEEEKRGKLVKVMEHVEDIQECIGNLGEREAESTPAPLLSTLDMYASILKAGESVKHTFKREKGYLHLAMRSGYKTNPTDGAMIKIGETELKEGDGAFLEGADGQEVEIQCVKGEAEFVLFDLE